MKQAMFVGQPLIQMLNLLEEAEHSMPAPIVANATQLGTPTSFKVASLTMKRGRILHETPPSTKKSSAKNYYSMKASPSAKASATPRHNDVLVMVDSDSN